MALRFILARSFSTHGPLTVPATTAAVATATPMPTVAEQMHADE
ncbi:MAG: hypothetical protein Q8L71_07750 [Thiobacillus sp.]|nr:hypothetical protein [Thiobacillus sp.]